MRVYEHKRSFFSIRVECYNIHYPNKGLALRARALSFPFARQIPKRKQKYAEARSCYRECRTSSLYVLCPQSYIYAHIQLRRAKNSHGSFLATPRVFASRSKALGVPASPYRAGDEGRGWVVDGGNGRIEG